MDFLAKVTDDPTITVSNFVPNSCQNWNPAFTHSAISRSPAATSHQPPYVANYQPPTLVVASHLVAKPLVAGG